MIEMAVVIAIMESPRPGGPSLRGHGAESGVRIALSPAAEARDRIHDIASK